MNLLLKSISFIFHPIIMPILGVIFYFSESPRYFTLGLIKAKLISLSILTIVLPILIYFLLKTLGKTHSIYLKTSKERVFPLVLNAVIILLVIKRVLPVDEIQELYYFFIGILISTLSCLIFALLEFKASIHMIAISGIFTFAITLSNYFNINLNGSLALIALLMGAVATSRLHLKAHTNLELFAGLVIGSVPQLVLISYWIN